MIRQITIFKIVDSRYLPRYRWYFKYGRVVCCSAKTYVSDTGAIDAVRQVIKKHFKFKQVRYVVRETNTYDITI